MPPKIDLTLLMDEIIYLYRDEGWCLKALGSYYGISWQTINRRLRDAGIDTNPIRRGVIRTIKCVDCNAEIITKAHNKTVCDICKKKRNTARNTERYRQGLLTPSQQKIKSLTLPDGYCDICKDFGPLHRDHDHNCCSGTSTKACGNCFRGGLCSSCNLALGQFKDDLSRLSAAIEYLKKWQGRNGC